jgi:hypothetical protein
VTARPAEPIRCGWKELPDGQPARFQVVEYKACQRFTEP